MRLFLQCDPFQICIDEKINASIQHCIHVSGFLVGTMILDHSIWLHNVRTDLVAPADICHFSTDTGKLCFRFLLFEKLQFGFQHLHGFVLIHMLGTFILTLYHNTGRQVSNTNGR